MAGLGVPRFLERLIALGETGTQQRDAGLEAFIPARVRGAASAVIVSPRSVRGIPAYGQAVRLAAEAVAGLRMAVWRGEGAELKRVSTVWQARLLRGALNPDQTRFEFWETIEESLGYRNNAYIWKLKSDRVTAMWALHPDQVAPSLRSGRVIYQVMLGNGYADPLGRGTQSVAVDRGTILHVRGHGGGGQIVAPSPISLYRSALAAAIAKEAHEERLYGRRAIMPLAIEFPEGVAKTTVKEFKELWQEQYGSVEATGETPVIGGGAKFAKIGLTQEDAQFVEAMNLSVEEIARITNVQASLLGVTRSARPLTPEHEEDRWHRYGLGPRLERIEAALEADPDLFGPGSSVRPMFDLGRGVRGDLTTEETMAHQQVQDGRLLVDEWRAMKGLPPLPGGAGSVPQIVPVGGGANPVPSAPVPAGDDDDDQE
jgi:HK97 family phage portal protein